MIILIGCANTVFYFITTFSSGRALMNMQFLNSLFYTSIDSLIRFAFYDSLISDNF